jgi:hypothetical protein
MQLNLFIKLYVLQLDKEEPNAAGFNCYFLKIIV